MSDDLRAPLVPAFERLATDIAVGRHGDPHVAFITFVYPDRRPEIVVVASKGSAQSLYNARKGKPRDVADDDSVTRQIWFAHEDLADASHALESARWAIRSLNAASEVSVGRQIEAKVERDWQARRESDLARQIERNRRPAECPHCHGHYTLRGLTQHLSRARWCSQQEQAAGDAANTAEVQP